MFLESFDNAFDAEQEDPCVPEVVTTIHHFKGIGRRGLLHEPLQLDGGQTVVFHRLAELQVSVSRFGMCGLDSERDELAFLGRIDGRID